MKALLSNLVLTRPGMAPLRNVATGARKQSYTDLFVQDNQTACYAANRPNYAKHCPRAYDVLFEYARLGKKDLAVDVATGSGQAIGPLAQVFKRVIGVDSSHTQLGHAPVLPNVEYMVGDAHSVGLPSGCVDLVNIAQALHWFDRPRFYQEVIRMLRPGGTLAIMTYDIGDLRHSQDPACGSASGSNVATGGSDMSHSGSATCTSGQTSVSEASARLSHLWREICYTKLGPYWPEPWDHVNDQYSRMEPLEPLFTDVVKVHLDMHLDITVDQLMGYVGSWSAYTAFRTAHPNEDPLASLRKNLLEALDEAGARPKPLTASPGKSAQPSTGDRDKKEATESSGAGKLLPAPARDSPEAQHSRGAQVQAVSAEPMLRLSKVLTLIMGRKPA